MGDAHSWAQSARNNGFITGQRPTPGAIVVYQSGTAGIRGWRGHVAYVEAVNGDYMTISESNCGETLPYLAPFPTPHQVNWKQWEGRGQEFIYLPSSSFNTGSQHFLQQNPR